MTDSALKTLSARVPFATVRWRSVGETTETERECPELGVSHSVSLFGGVLVQQYTHEELKLNREDLWTLLRDVPGLADKARRLYGD